MNFAPVASFQFSCAFRWFVAMPVIEFLSLRFRRWSRGWSSRCCGCPQCVYGWVGIAGPHQLNSCQNFSLLKQITNNKQTNNKQTNKILIKLNNSWCSSAVNMGLQIDRVASVSPRGTWKTFYVFPPPSSPYFALPGGKTYQKNPWAYQWSGSTQLTDLRIHGASFGQDVSSQAD